MWKRLADLTLKTTGGTGLSLALDFPEQLGSRGVHVRLLERSLTGRKVTLRCSRRPTGRRCINCLSNDSITFVTLLSATVAVHTAHKSNAQYSKQEGISQTNSRTNADATHVPT